MLDLGAADDTKLISKVKNEFLDLKNIHFDT